jgi:hypothetical protein
MEWHELLNLLQLDGQMHCIYLGLVLSGFAITLPSLHAKQPTLSKLHRAENLS